MKLAVPLASEAACAFQNSSEIALRFAGDARFIQNLYPIARGTALKRNVAQAAAFEPRLIVTFSLPDRRMSMRYGCLNTVGVAVGMLVGAAFSPGANGARVSGSNVGYGDGSRVSSEGAQLGSTVGIPDGSSVGGSLGSAVGGSDGAGDVGSRLGCAVGAGVGGVGTRVVGAAEGWGVDSVADGSGVVGVVVVGMPVGC